MHFLELNKLLKHESKHGVRLQQGTPLWGLETPVYLQSKSASGWRLGGARVVDLGFYEGI